MENQRVNLIKLCVNTKAFTIQVFNECFEGIKKTIKKRCDISSLGYPVYPGIQLVAEQQQKWWETRPGLNKSKRCFLTPNTLTFIPVETILSAYPLFTECLQQACTNQISSAPGKYSL